MHVLYRVVIILYGWVLEAIFCSVGVNHRVLPSCLSMPRNDIEILDTRQSVELGEGVEIHLRIAGPFPRALALLLDTLIIAGIMMESHLVEGKQKASPMELLTYGQSVTDACLGWEETEGVLSQFYKTVSKNI